MKKRERLTVQIIASDREKTGVLTFVVDRPTPWLATDVKNIKKMKSFFPEILREVVFAREENADFARYIAPDHELYPTYRSGLKRK